ISFILFGVWSLFRKLICKYAQSFPYLVAHSGWVSLLLSPVVVLIYVAVAAWFSVPLLSVSFDNKDPWELDRSDTGDHSISIMLTPSRRLKGVKVYIHSINLKSLGSRHDLNINSNIDMQIGWLGGVKSFDPIDIETTGVLWPIVFLQKKPQVT